MNDDFNKAKDAMSQVKQDVKSGLRDVGDTAANTARNVRRDVSDAADTDVVGEIKDQAKEYASLASDKIGDAALGIRDSVEEFVVEQPWQGVAFAALGGAILGAWLFAGRR